MAKFELPFTSESFKSLFTTEGWRKLMDAVGKDKDVAFVYSCFKNGYANKMHHKQKTMEDREIIRRFREQEKAQAAGRVNQSEGAKLVRK